MKKELNSKPQSKNQIGIQKENQEKKQNSDHKMEEVIYNIAPEEINFIQQLFTNSISRKGFRKGKIPAILVNHYKGKEILNLILEINYQKTIEEFKTNNKIVKEVKLIETKPDNNYGLEILCHIFYEDITEEKPEISEKESEKNHDSNNLEHKNSTNKLNKKTHKKLNKSDETN